MDLWSFVGIYGHSKEFVVVQYDLQSFSPNSCKKHVHGREFESKRQASENRRWS